MGHLHELFDRHFEENKLEKWGDQHTDVDDVLEASNRYLTPKKDVPIGQSVPFNKYMDPKGILEEMLGEGDGFVHTEDNVVEYFEQKMDPNNTRR